MNVNLGPFRINLDFILTDQVFKRHKAQTTLMCKDLVRITDRFSAEFAASFFDMIDTDSSGTLDTAEYNLLSAMLSGITDMQTLDIKELLLRWTRNIFNFVDKNGDGSLSRGEVLHLMLKKFAPFLSQLLLHLCNALCDVTAALLKVLLLHVHEKVNKQHGETAGSTELTLHHIYTASGIIQADDTPQGAVAADPDDSELGRAKTNEVLMDNVLIPNKPILQLVEPVDGWHIRSVDQCEVFVSGNRARLDELHVVACLSAAAGDHGEHDDRVRVWTFSTLTHTQVFTDLPLLKNDRKVACNLTFCKISPDGQHVVAGGISTREQVPVILLWSKTTDAQAGQKWQWQKRSEVDRWPKVLEFVESQPDSFVRHGSFSSDSVYFVAACESVATSVQAHHDLHSKLACWDMHGAMHKQVAVGVVPKSIGHVSLRMRKDAGITIAACGDGRDIYLWTGTTPFSTAQIILQGHDDKVNCVCIAQKTGQAEQHGPFPHVLSCSDDGSVRFWCVAETPATAGYIHYQSNVLFELKGHGSPVFDCRFSQHLTSDGSAPNVAISCSAGTVICWDLQRGVPLRTIERFDAQAPICRCVFGGESVLDSQILLCQGEDLCSYSLHSGMPLKVFTARGADFTECLLGSSGNIVTTTDRELRLITQHGLAETVLDQPLNGADHRVPLSSVRMSQTGELVAVGDRDGRVMIWKRHRGETQSWAAEWSGDRHSESVCKHTLTGHQGAVLDIQFGKDDRVIATCGEDSTIRLWTMQGHRFTAATQPFVEDKVLEGHRQAVSGVVLFGGDESLRAISHSLDSTIRIWNTKSGRCLYMYKDRHVVPASIALRGGHISDSVFSMLKECEDLVASLNASRTEAEAMIEPRMEVHFSDASSNVQPNETYYLCKLSAAVPDLLTIPQRKLLVTAMNERARASDSRWGRLGTMFRTADSKSETEQADRKRDDAKSAADAKASKTLKRSFTMHVIPRLNQLLHASGFEDMYLKVATSTFPGSVPGAASEQHRVRTDLAALATDDGNQPALGRDQCVCIMVKLKAKGEHKVTHAALHAVLERLQGIIARDCRQILCSTSADLRLWDVPSWPVKSVQQLGTTCTLLQGHEGLVYDCCFSEDESHAVSCGADGSIRVWSLDRSDEQALDGAKPDIISAHRCMISAGDPLHKHCARKVVLSPHARRVISMAEDGVLRLWDVEAFEVVKTGRLAMASSTISPLRWYVLPSDPRKDKIVGSGYHHCNLDANTTIIAMVYGRRVEFLLHPCWWLSDGGPSPGGMWLTIQSELVSGALSNRPLTEQIGGQISNASQYCIGRDDELRFVSKTRMQDAGLELPLPKFKHTAALLKRFPHTIFEPDSADEDKTMIHKAVSWTRPHANFFDGWTEARVTLLPVLELLVVLRPGATLLAGKDSSALRQTPYKLMFSRLQCNADVRARWAAAANGPQHHVTSLPSFGKGTNSGRSWWHEDKESRSTRQLLLNASSDEYGAGSVIDKVVHENVASAVSILIQDDWLPFVVQAERTVDKDHTRAFEIPTKVPKTPLPLMHWVVREGLHAAADRVAQWCDAPNNRLTAKMLLDICKGVPVKGKELFQDIIKGGNGGVGLRKVVSTVSIRARINFERTNSRETAFWLKGSNYPLPTTADASQDTANRRKQRGPHSRSCDLSSMSSCVSTRTRHVVDQLEPFWDGELTMRALSETLHAKCCQSFGRSLP